MLLFANFNQIEVHHKPNFIKRFSTTIRHHFPVKGRLLQKLLIPFHWITGLSSYILVPTYLCIRYRPKICVTDSQWVAVVFGLSRKLGFSHYTIYCPGDWFIVDKKKEPLRYLIITIFFHWMDYLAVSLNDLVVNISPEVTRLRTQYWKKDVVKYGVLTFPVPLNINENVTDNHRNYICFLGMVREDSGLKSLLSVLPALNAKHGIKMKLFGPDNHSRSSFQKRVMEQGLEDLIEFYGWINMETECDLIMDCFCGINLINSENNHFNSENNHSGFSTPGKLMHYMQNLIVPIITQTSASLSFIEFLQKNHLGIVTEPDLKQIESAIEVLFKKQQFFRDNLRKYASDYPYITIGKHLETIKHLKAIEKKEKVFTPSGPEKC